MDKLNSVIPCFLSVCGTGIGYFLGGFDTAIYTLITFLIVDYITGIMASLKERRFNYDVGFWGIVKKIFVLILVGIAASLDNILGTEQVIIRMAVIFFYLGIEGLSIIENASKIGIPIPEVLTKWFVNLKKDGEKS